MGCATEMLVSKIENFLPLPYYMQYLKLLVLVFCCRFGVFSFVSARDQAVKFEDAQLAGFFALTVGRRVCASKSKLSL